MPPHFEDQKTKSSGLGINNNNNNNKTFIKVHFCMRMRPQGTA